MITCGINRRILPEHCDPREVHVTRSHGVLLQIAWVLFVHLLLSVLPRMQPPGFFLSYSCSPASEPHRRCSTTAHYLLFIAFLLLGFRMYFYLFFENSIHICNVFWSNPLPTPSPTPLFFFLCSCALINMLEVGNVVSWENTECTDLCVPLC